MWNLWAVIRLVLSSRLILSRLSFRFYFFFVIVRSNVFRSNGRYIDFLAKFINPLKGGVLMWKTGAVWKCFLLFYRYIIKPLNCDPNCDLVNRILFQILSPSMPCCRWCSFDWIVLLVNLLRKILECLLLFIHYLQVQLQVCFINGNFWILFITNILKEIQVFIIVSIQLKLYPVLRTQKKERDI